MRRSHLFGTRSLMVVLVVAVVTLPSAAQLPTVQRMLREHDLVRSPADYLELSFPNPSAVKNFVSAFGETSMQFLLTSHLSEGTRVSWQVSATPEGGTRQVVAEGQETMQPAQAVTKTTTTTIDCSQGRVLVTVTAQPDKTGAKQVEIHFWVVQDGERKGRMLCRAA